MQEINCKRLEVKVHQRRYRAEAGNPRKNVDFFRRGSRISFRSSEIFIFTSIGLGLGLGPVAELGVEEPRHAGGGVAPVDGAGEVGAGGGASPPVVLLVGLASPSHP